jgi:hypothetical protein
MSKNYALERELQSLKRKNQKIQDQNRSLQDSIHSQQQQIVSLKKDNKSLCEGMKRQKSANASLLKKINSAKLEQQSKLARLQELYEKQEFLLRSEIAKLKEAKDTKAKLKASSIVVTPHSTADSTIASRNSFRFTFSEGKGEWEPFDTVRPDETLPFNLSMGSSGSVTGVKGVPKRIPEMVLPGRKNVKPESASTSPSKHWRRYHLSRNNNFSGKAGVKEDESRPPILRHSPSSLALALESLSSQERRSSSREERSNHSAKSSKSSLSKALESSRRLC